MRNRGTAAGVPGEQTYAFSTPYEKTSPSKGGTRGTCVGAGPPPAECRGLGRSGAGPAWPPRGRAAAAEGPQPSMDSPTASGGGAGAGRLPPRLDAGLGAQGGASPTTPPPAP